MRGQRQTEKKVACTGPSPKHETHVWAWEGEAEGSIRALLACTQPHARTLRFTQFTAFLEAEAR